jgi:sulfonate dioxygenase
LNLLVRFPSIPHCRTLSYPSPSDHVDVGTRADPKKPHLLNPNVITRDISPYLGTEVSGIQLSELTKEGLDELALFAAERKVLIFRDQDFKDIGPDRQIEVAKFVFSIYLSVFFQSCLTTMSLRHFGPLHRHPFTANIKGYPEFHVGESISTLNLLCGA